MDPGFSLDRISETKISCRGSWRPIIQECQIWTEASKINDQGHLPISHLHIWHDWIRWSLIRSRINDQNTDIPGSSMIKDQKPEIKHQRSYITYCPSACPVPCVPDWWSPSFWRRMRRRRAKCHCCCSAGDGGAESWCHRRRWTLTRWMPYEWVDKGAEDKRSTDKGPSFKMALYSPHYWIFFFFWG